MILQLTLGFFEASPFAILADPLPLLGRVAPENYGFLARMIFHDFYDLLRDIAYREDANPKKDDAESMKYMALNLMLAKRRLRDANTSPAREQGLAMIDTALEGVAYFISDHDDLFTRPALSYFQDFAFRIPGVIQPRNLLREEIAALPSACSDKAFRRIFDLNSDINKMIEGPDYFDLDLEEPIEPGDRHVEPALNKALLEVLGGRAVIQQSPRDFVYKSAEESSEAWFRPAAELASGIRISQVESPRDREIVYLHSVDGGAALGELLAEASQEIIPREEISKAEEIELSFLAELADKGYKNWTVSYANKVHYIFLLKVLRQHKDAEMDSADLPKQVQAFMDDRHSDNLRDSLELREDQLDPRSRRAIDFFNKLKALAREKSASVVLETEQMLKSTDPWYEKAIGQKSVWYGEIISKEDDMDGSVVYISKASTAQDEGDLALQMSHHATELAARKGWGTIANALRRDGDSPKTFKAVGLNLGHANDNLRMRYSPLDLVVIDDRKNDGESSEPRSGPPEGAKPSPKPSPLVPTLGT